jgi:hypothetical protein
MSGAREQGLTVNEVLREAGVSRFYLKNFPQPTEGRSTNIVMHLARITSASPATLFEIEGVAWVPVVEQLAKALEPWCHYRADVKATIDDDGIMTLGGAGPRGGDFRRQHLTAAAQAFTAYLIALAAVYDGDAVALVNSVLRQVARNLRQASQPELEPDVALD